MIRATMLAPLLLLVMHAPVAAQGPGSRGPGSRGPNVRQTPSTGKATNIFDAATLGRLDDVRAFLDDKPQLATIEDPDQRTPLHLASRYGHVDIVELLLARDAKPDVKAYNQFTPLHLAITFNRPKVLEVLLKQNVDVNAKTAFDRTPIELAAERFRWELVDRLLAAGADYTAYTAASRGDLKQVTKLLQPQNAKVSRDALLRAIHLGHAELAILMLPRVKATPLMPNEARQPWLFEATQHATVMKALLAAGEDPAERSTAQPMGGPPAGSTVLHAAAARGHTETVAVLLQHEQFADPDVRNTTQNTPAHEAALHGKLETLQLLHKSGAVLRKKDRLGRTTVHHAAIAGKPETLHWLVKLGIVLHDKDNAGRTALQLATKGIHPSDGSTKNRLESAWVLVRHGVAVDLLSAAVIGDTARAKVLLEADRKLADREGLLIRAMSFGHRDIVALLLDAEAEVNALDSRGSNYLHWAGLWRQAECAQLLIERGCNVHATNKWGFTPLHEAARGNATGVAKVLLAAGAKRTDKDRQGNTPLGLLTNISPAELRELLQH